MKKGAKWCQLVRDAGFVNAQTDYAGYLVAYSPTLPPIANVAHIAESIGMLPRINIT